MTPILHHYPASLFSEKIRALFGYLRLEWQSVIIAPIMPRPLLMPLSGGYRKTPILQIGANVYCDTQVICRKLAKLAGNATLYAGGFTAERVAQWADSELFRTTVALNFREEALAAQMSQLSPEAVAAFQKDREQLSGGAPIVGVPPAAALAHFGEYLGSLESSLHEDFLLGDVPSIADFSVYHCLWFVAGNPVNTALFDDFPRVRDYMARLRAYGHGTFSEIDAAEALATGRDTSPVLPDDARVDARLAGAIAAGQSVGVAATDYGRNPITGSLVKWTAEEIVIRRQDPEAGEVMVHFPNTGFAVSA
ncbi:MAG: glutathione S-transferase family protein [Pseudomonadales bacterium]|nr:glutathione S-transferase family protein [Pseudomonadales bacterium]